MDSKERAQAIRHGNELFNNGEYAAAEKLFIQTGYRDGLIRIGDHLYYDLRQPLAAFKYYKMAKSTKKVNEIFERMVFAFKTLLSGKEEEVLSHEKIHLEPVKVHPKLKLAAQEILQKNEAGE